MNQKVYRLIIISGISLSLIACKGKEKTTEPAANDSTGTTTTTTDNTVKDALTAAPNYYKLLKDTMGISVIEANYQPGDSSALHSHRDYAVYTDQTANATFYGQDGKATPVTMPAGTFMIHGAEVHSVKNTGNAPIKVILVEVNRGMTPTTWDKTLDATKVAPNLYKLVKDTLGMRAIMVNYKPGQSAPMHAHPNVALYVLKGSTAEFTDKEGKKTNVEMKTGMVIIVPSDMHAAKNIGKTDMKAIMVEVDRQ